MNGALLKKVENKNKILSLIFLKIFEIIKKKIIK
jgi:hypothetical protein